MSLCPTPLPRPSQVMDFPVPLPVEHGPDLLGGGHAGDALMHALDAVQHAAHLPAKCLQLGLSCDLPSLLPPAGGFLRVCLCMRACVRACGPAWVGV